MRDESTIRTAAAVSIAIVGCGSPDEGDFGGTAVDTEGPPPDPQNACAPKFNPDDPPEDPRTHVCEGSGFGILRFDVCDLDCIGSVNQRDPRAECFPGGDEPVDSMCPQVIQFPEDPNNDFGDIPVPLACCDVANDATQGTVPGVCLDDCLWAACKLAVVELAQQAEAQLMDGGLGTGNAAEDLQFWSDMLAQPTALQACVDKARNGEPFDLGDGVNNPDVILAGDLSNGRLEIFCGIDDVVLPSDAATCEENPNFVPVEDVPGSGPVIGGSLIIEGPLGDADADVLGVDMTVRFDPCEGEVCGILLTSLDIELTDVFLGQLQFEDIEASLVRPARGVVRGEEVIFGHSSLVAEVEFGLRFLGLPLFDGARIPVLVANVGTAHGTLTPDGVFSLDEAVFQLGPQRATLTIAPSPITLDSI